MPGGKINWTRTIIMLLVGALVLYLLWKMLSPILDFFAGGEKTPDVKINSEEVVQKIRAKGLQVDPNFNVEFWVNELTRVLEKTVWYIFDNDRCNVLTKTNALGDAELTTVAIAYKIGTGRNLRKDVLGLYVSGCSGKLVVDDLVRHLERLDEAAIV